MHRSLDDVGDTLLVTIDTLDGHDVPILARGALIVIRDAAVPHFALDRGSSSANIGAELAGRQASLEHLVNLFQRSALDLREVEVDEKSSEQTGRYPDVTVLRTPVERRRVDEVWRSEAMTTSVECKRDLSLIHI